MQVLLLGVISCCFPQDYAGPSLLLTPYCSLDCSDKSAHTFNTRRENQGPKRRELYKHWDKTEGGYTKGKDKVR